MLPSDSSKKKLLALAAVTAIGTRALLVAKRRKAERLAAKVERAPAKLKRKAAAGVSKAKRAGKKIARKSR
jgi:hypothetical protein